MPSHSFPAPGSVRPAAFAGMFYPDEVGPLRRMVNDFVKGAPVRLEKPPKALIAPHAGYLYSGAIAGTAFAPLTNAEEIRRVVVIGPSHRVAFQGIAVPSATAFMTPLGPVPVDAAAIQQLLTLPQVRCLDAPHKDEHSLEVELPFLQLTLKHFELVPLVAGDASGEEVGEILQLLWGGPETVFVISSDLSHYLDYESACQLDRRTADAIEALRPADIGFEQACGRIPICGLLWAARRQRLGAETLDLRNSGDTAGRRDRVVGYGAFAFQPESGRRPQGRVET